MKNSSFGWSISAVEKWVVHGGVVTTMTTVEETSMKVEKQGHGGQGQQRKAMVQ